jgi:AcrR family transcriptional regulator
MARRYKTGIETRARIVEATRELLAETGLDGITLQAICTRAGVRSGSFYNLFESKDEVVLTVVREAIEAVDPDPEGTGTDTVADLVEAYVTFIETRPDLARIYAQMAVAGSSPANLRGRVLRHHRRRVERFGNAMARERPDLSPAEARRRGELLVAGLNGAALFTMIDGDRSFADLAHAMFKDVWSGS